MENRKRVSCRKHPKHQQSPGVCSLCLNERLSKISSTSSSSSSNPLTLVGMKVSSSSSSSSISSVSSSRCSSNASPMHGHENRSKLLTSNVEGKGYLYGFLRKSRSMAYVGKKINVEDDGKRKKGGGFWSKLIGLKRSSKSSSKLMHSRTMRDMLTTRI